MDSISWGLISMLTFALGIYVGCMLIDKTNCKKLKKELDREWKYSNQCLKEKNDYFDKYTEEVVKNKMYKLWIYEQIRDKRSDEYGRK